MQKFKKPVSIILSILMVVSMFVVVPFTASAAGEVAEVNGTQYTTLAAAIADAQAGDTVKLVANVTEAVSITGKTLTLDLNGFNITSPSSTQPIKAYGGTKLTITNSNTAKSENTPTQNAVLGSTGGTNNYGSLFASGEGTEVIINAGYYYGYNGDKTAIHAVNKAKVIFNDCVVNGAAGFDGTGTSGKEGKIFYSGVGNPTQPYAMDPGYIEVYGGTFSGRMSDSNWGNYKIAGGTFDRNVVVINANPVDANGNRVATASGNMEKIKDGTFYDSNWLAPGFAPVANGDNTFTVKGPYAAMIGETGYATLAAAIDAAQNGATVKLVANVTETVTVSRKTLTLDLNGFNITSASSSKMAVNANNGTKLTITNSNTAKSENTPTQNAILGGTGSNNRGSLSASGEGTTVDIRAGYYYGYNGNKTAIHAINDATITFYDCVVNGAQGIDDSTTGKEGKVFYSGVNNPAKPDDETPGYIVVHGGVFNGRMSDSNWGNYLIDGGTFDRNSVVLNENPVDANGNRVATSSGSMATLPNSPGTLEEAGWLAPGFAPVANGDGTFTVDGPYAAMIGETGYATLAAAIAAAQAGDTVKLVANVTETVTVSGKTLTLDLNGFNITSASSSKMAVNANNGTKLTITNSNTAKSENTPTQNAILGGTGSNNRGSLSASGEGTTVDIYAGYYYGYNGNKTAIHAINDATITFYDCVVNGAQGIDDSTTGKEGKVFYSGVNNPTKPDVETPGYIVVHGGVFNGRMSDSNWGNYVIDGGTFDRNSVVLNENPVDANGNRVATSSGSMATLPNSPGTLEEAGWLAPGYKVVDNGNGTYGVTKKLFVGHNLLLGGDIGVNFYLNPEILDSYNGTKTVKFTCDGVETTVNVPSTATDYGYKVTLNVVAARMAHKIHAVVYVGNTALAETDSYSVQDYAEAVYKNPEAYDTKGKSNKAKALAKAMLNYGSEAQTVFASSLTQHPDRADKTVGQTSYTNVTADAVTAKIHGSASNLENVAEQLNAKYYTNSLIYLQNNTLRVYFTPKTYPSTMPNAGAYTGNLSNYYYYTDVAGIAAAELDEQQDFEVGNVTFKYSALNYVVNVLNSGDKMDSAQKNLAKSLFLYNQAANAYF